MWKEGHSKYQRRRIHENIINIFQLEGLWPLWKAVKLAMTLPLYIAPGMIADSLSVPIFVNQISAWATSGGPLSSLVRVVNIANHAFLCDIELNVSEEITCKRQNQSFLSNKHFQSIISNLTNNKNELWNLLGQQVFKNPQSQSVSIFLKFLHPCLSWYLYR